MKRLLLLLALVSVSLANVCYAQDTRSICFTTNGTNCVPGIQGWQSKPINISTATTTELVAAVTSQSIFVTTWDVMAGGTGNLTLEYGTGTTCGTGTTTLTGAYPLIAQ